MVFLHVPFFVMFMQFFYKTYSLKTSLKKATAKTSCVPQPAAAANNNHVSNGHAAKKHD